LRDQLAQEFEEVRTERDLLRAFLQNNSAFRLEFFTSFLRRVHGERLGELMPLCLEHPGGSIWLRKLSE
jgi:hypothetical protein